MTYESEHLHQVDQGRRNTLHVNKPRRDFNTRGPKIKKSTGHEAFLKGLEGGGAEVKLKLMDGSMISGKLTHSDKFTLTLNTILADNTESRDVLFFKHDISYLYSLTPKAVVEAVNEDSGNK